MLMTVLGKSPSWQDAGGACSGYLIADGGTNLLLDCGNGVFSRLREHMDYVDVDAVLVSHLHADHFLDLVPFAYALTYTPRQQPVPVAGHPGTQSPARPRLIAPSGARELFRRVVGAWGNEDLIEAAFELEEYDADSVVQIGPMTARFREVPHFTRTFAVDIATENASRMTYSADCRPTDVLVDLARDTGLFLVEATLPRPERTGHRGHMTPAEAAEHAARAGARRVIITHISDELDLDAALAEAAAVYEGPIEIARQGAEYEI